jgi:hypothetical protein
MALHINFTSVCQSFFLALVELFCENIVFQEIEEKNTPLFPNYCSVRTLCFRQGPVVQF